MSNAARPRSLFCDRPVIDKSEQMTEAQRLCLLHILRNIASGIVGTISLLENEKSTPSRETLISCLKGVPFLVERVVCALEAGSFCTLNEEECSFVGPHVGCRPPGDIVKVSQSPRQKV